MWVGQSPKRIVEGFAEALLRTLRVEFVYARVDALNLGGGLIEAVSTERGALQCPSPSDVGSRLAPWLQSGEASPTALVPSPLPAGGRVRLSVAPVGHVFGALGIVAAGSARSDFASDYDRLLMRVGANQLATALQTAQLQAAQAEVEQGRRVAELLEERVTERTRELESLYRADQLLHASLRLDDVLRALADVATDVLAMRKAIVYAPDDSGERLVVRVVHGFRSATISQLSLARDEGIVAEVMRTRLPVSVANIHTDPRASLRAARLLEPEDVYGLLSVPIVVRAEVIAVLNIYRPDQREFDEDQKRVVVALAQRAGVAIENARLYETAGTVAALEERNRLARELHDSVSQALYAITLDLSAAQELSKSDPSRLQGILEDARAVAATAFAEMRSVIFELRPESLQQDGLVAALERRVAAVQARFGIPIRATLPPEPDVSLAIKEVVYRVAQEALQNSAKHAAARGLTVSLDEGHGELSLRVGDDGRGFDPQGSFPGHLGLRSMRERVEAVGGVFKIRSDADRGTEVSVRITYDPPFRGKPIS